MNQSITIDRSCSFLRFLLDENRNIIRISFSVIIIQLCVFKYLYPFPNFIHGDSFAYINAANMNSAINFYPIGYSKFLRLISVFSKSDIFLTTLQYLIVQSSVLFLVFTIEYFYRISKPAKIILLCMTVLNPLLLHLANLVSSDCLFLSISFYWFATLVWLINKPTTKVLLCHTVLLLWAFSVRYNAVIYPIVSVLAVYLLRQSFQRKLFYILAIITTIGAFVSLTSMHFWKLTGIWQFSPFSGWQLANNAMYSYRYVDSIERVNVPGKFRALDKMVRNYFDSNRYSTSELYKASTVYMWDKAVSPLYKYRDSVFSKEPKASEFKKWASMGKDLGGYGRWIILQYPREFALHFLWPNLNRYMAPPVEFLQYYNSGKDTVTTVAKEWFGFRNKTVNTRLASSKIVVLDLIPVFAGVSCLIFICLALYVYSLLYNRFDAGRRNIITISSLFWLLSMGFSVFASSIALRFQAFHVCFEIIVIVFLMDLVVKDIRDEKNTMSKRTRAKAFVENI